MFKLRSVMFHFPPLRSSDVSISSTQIRHRGGGFAISLLSSFLRWRCGGGFCSGSVLVWIGDREFGFLWVCWISVSFGLCFWFWVYCWVVGIVSGFVAFVGGWWSADLGLWVFLMPLLSW